MSGGILRPRLVTLKMRQSMPHSVPLMLCSNFQKWIPFSIASYCSLLLLIFMKIPYIRHVRKVSSWSYALTSWSYALNLKWKKRLADWLAVKCLRPIQTTGWNWMGMKVSRCVCHSYLLWHTHRLWKKFWKFDLYMGRIIEGPLETFLSPLAYGHKRPLL